MDAPANPFRAYDVTSPTGESFSAAVVIGEDGFWHVLSDRSGTWADEPGIAMEDLLMPEQNMAEWDIVPAGKRTNGNGTEPKAPDAKKKDRSRLDAFDPDQPRIPAGEAGGGQWTAEGGGFSPAGPAQRVKYTASTAGEQGEYDPRFFRHERYIEEYEGKPLDMGRDRLIPTHAHEGDLPGAVADPDVIFRGMSAGEFASIMERGEVRGLGEFNIGKQQEGLTYYATDPRSAQSYANSFAPSKFKPDWEQPAYVVAVKRPSAERLRKVPGVGENEVGVMGGVSEQDIVAVYRGDVIQRTPHMSRHGVTSSASATLHWQKLERRNGGQWRGGGGGGGAIAQAKGSTRERIAERAEEIGKRRSYIQVKSQQIAQDLGFPPTQVEAVTGTKKFKVGDKEYTTAGEAYRDTGKIVIYSDHVAQDDYELKGLVAHEVEHQRFNHVFKRYMDEAMTVQDLAKDVGSVFNVDGSLMPPYDKQFPVYEAWNKLYQKKVKTLHKQDGVSDYSRAYWDALAAGKPGVDTLAAVHETLAEIARFDAQGIATRLIAIKERPAWVAFYDWINDQYDASRGQDVTEPLSPKLKAERKRLKQAAMQGEA